MGHAYLPVHAVSAGRHVWACLHELLLTVLGGIRPGGGAVRRMERGHAALAAVPPAPREGPAPRPASVEAQLSSTPSEAGLHGAPTSHGVLPDRAVVREGGPPGNSAGARAGGAGVSAVVAAAALVDLEAAIEAEEGIEWEAANRVVS